MALVHGEVVTRWPFIIRLWVDEIDILNTRKGFSARALIREEVQVLRRLWRRNFVDEKFDKSNVRTDEWMRVQSVQENGYERFVHRIEEN